MTIFRRHEASQKVFARRLLSIVCVIVVFKIGNYLDDSPASRPFTVVVDVAPSLKPNTTMADKTIPPSHVKQSPSSTKRKPKSKSTTPNTNDFLCKKLHKSSVFQQIQIANSKNKASPKILCFIMSHSKATTKINAVLKTWGRKCDKLLIASNETDSRIGAVKMNSEASYLGLWNKLNETMTYIWNEFGADQFEWVLKADDDTFVIMENLKEYLSSLPSTRMSSQPSIHGRRFSSPKYKHLEWDEYFTNPQNTDFGKRFYAKMDRNAPVIYNHGGSAYVMNMEYVQKFVEVMHGPDTVHGTPAEDMAHGVVMAYHDLWPTNTRDELGRERFHPKDPQLMYNMPEDKFRLFNDNHQPTGGLSVGVDCCSEKSITFHHIKPSNMIALERVFYTCRGL